MAEILEKNTITDVDQRLSTVRRLVGHTPMVQLDRIFPHSTVTLCAKLEWQQIGHSVKTRPAFCMIRQGLQRGELDYGRRLLDASSGNTAVALAAIAASVGIPVTLVVPENAASHKVAHLRALGAELIFSSRYEGTDGAQNVARELAADHPSRYWYADQYNNDDNWKAHYEMTGTEIYDQSGGAVTHFVAGLGTTGTFVGTARKLKELDGNVRTIALQPDLAMHGLEGWKHLETAKSPGIYDATLADDTFVVGTEEALEVLKRVAVDEGMVISPSAAANLAGAMKVAERITAGIVVTIFPDAGYNYPEVLKEIFN